MASIKDQEKLLNSLIHQNDLEISDETLEYLRNPTTPEGAKLDALIDLMSNTMRSLEETNTRLDVQHQEHIENQQKAEVWRKEDLKSNKFSNRMGIATLIATIAGIFVGGAITIGVQLLTG